MPCTTGRRAGNSSTMESDLALDVTSAMGPLIHPSPPSGRLLGRNVPVPVRLVTKPCHCRHLIGSPVDRRSHPIGLLHLQATFNSSSSSSDRTHPD